MGDDERVPDPVAPGRARRWRPLWWGIGGVVVAASLWYGSLRLVGWWVETAKRAALRDAIDAMVAERLVTSSILIKSEYPAAVRDLRVWIERKGAADETILEAPWLPPYGRKVVYVDTRSVPFRVHMSYLDEEGTAVVLDDAVAFTQSGSEWFEVRLRDEKAAPRDR